LPEGKSNQFRNKAMEILGIKRRFV
jgi:hypothetical protein